MTGPRLAQWLRTFVPASVNVSRREIALGCLGVVVTRHDFFVGHETALTSAGQGAWFVGDIMTREVLAARPGQDLVELVPAFSDEGRLAGMVTQSDLVAALFRAGLERP